MQNIKVFLSNGTSYETNIADGLKLEEVKAYWLNQHFTQPDETSLECIGIEYQGQLYKGWKMQEADLRITLMTQGIKQDDIFNTQELRAKYEVLGFEAPFVVVQDKTTGKRGSFQFTHMPRLYWGFVSE